MIERSMGVKYRNIEIYLITILNTFFVINFLKMLDQTQHSFLRHQLYYVVLVNIWLHSYDSNKRQARPN